MTSINNEVYRASRSSDGPGSAAWHRQSTASIASSRTSTSRSSSLYPTASTLADTTGACRRTTGERPPPLVGCSVTLLGDVVYVFGGRHVSSREMVNHLWALDLRTLNWARLFPPKPPAAAGSQPHPTLLHDGGPKPRYFHSCVAWSTKLVVFGGEAYADDAAAAPAETGEAPPMTTLGDVAVWDSVTGTWELAQPPCAEGMGRPVSRYAHLATVCSVGPGNDDHDDGAGTRGGAGEPASPGTERSVMAILGGQHLNNDYIQEISVLDLDAMRWVRAIPWKRHVGTYRAVATSAPWTVVPGGPVATPPKAGLRPQLSRSSSAGSDTFAKGSAPSSLPAHKLDSLRRELLSASPDPIGQVDPLVQLPYSTRPTVLRPEPLLVFSNHTFTKVKRELDVVSAPVAPHYSAATAALPSAFAAGAPLPPGLRFPTGHVVGTHLVIYGTYVSPDKDGAGTSSFAVWALDLGVDGGVGLKERAERGEALGWQRIDPGSVLARGSWNKAVGWRNSVVVLGDRERDIGDDYHHRQTNFAHVALIDLESFGIYRPPPRALPPAAQAFGLATLYQPGLADFEIICSDNHRLACSRALLAARWPWLATHLAAFKQRAAVMLAAQQRRHDPDAGADGDGQNQNQTQNGADLPVPAPDSRRPSLGTSGAPGSELRLTPRTLHLPHASAVVLAFLQFLYTRALCTPLQLQPDVLCALLVFARAYGENDLRALCVHGLHGVLRAEAAAGARAAARGGAPASAEGVFVAASLGGAGGLRMAALRGMMQPRRPVSQARPKPAPPLPTPASAASAEAGLARSVMA